MLQWSRASGWLENVCFEGTQPAGSQGEDLEVGLAGLTQPMSKEAGAVEWGLALWAAHGGWDRAGPQWHVHLSLGQVGGRTVG